MLRELDILLVRVDNASRALFEGCFELDIISTGVNRKDCVDLLMV